MRIIKPLLFLALLLLMVEITFRIYMFGIGSLNPMLMNSYTQIHDSGIAQPARIPGVYYELRPNYDGWFKGARFSTNAEGLRDHEYSLRKPDDTFRVAVLGSSWTMGSGVQQEEIWHSVIESKLNIDNGATHYEFINFAVDQYGLGEIIATLEHKVPAYQPDLVIIAITHYTPTVLWLDPSAVYVEQPRRNSFFNFYTLRVIDMRLQLGLYSDSDTSRESFEGHTTVREQLERAADRIETFNKQTRIPVAVVKLAYTRGWATKAATDTSVFDADHEFVYFNIQDAIISHGYKGEQLRISIWDSHPNAMAHQLIAEEVLAGLRQNNLLPVTTSSSAAP